MKVVLFYVLVLDKAHSRLFFIKRGNIPRILGNDRLAGRSAPQFNWWSLSPHMGLHRPVWRLTSLASGCVITAGPRVLDQLVQVSPRNHFFKKQS